MDTVERRRPLQEGVGNRRVDFDWAIGRILQGEGLTSAGAKDFRRGFPLGSGCWSIHERRSTWTGRPTKGGTEGRLGPGNARVQRREGRKDDGATGEGKRPSGRNSEVG